MVKPRKPKKPIRGDFLRGIKNNLEEQRKALQRQFNEIPNELSAATKRAIRDQRREDEKQARETERAAYKEYREGYRGQIERDESFPIWGGAMYLEPDTPQAVYEAIMANKDLRRIAMNDYRGAFDHAKADVILRDIHEAHSGKKSYSRNPRKGYKSYVDWKAWRDSHGYGRKSGK